MEVDLPRGADKSTVSRPWASLDYSGFRLIFVLSLFATTAQQMRQTQNLRSTSFPVRRFSWA